MIQKPVIALLGGIVMFWMLSGAVRVDAAPPADAIKQVIDYYYNGQNEGPTLVDAKICKTVHDLQCKTEIGDGPVPKGDTIHLWMQFFVPNDAVYDDIMVEYAHEGVPRSLTPYTIKGSIRYRVVDQHKLNKPGTWKITVKKGTTNLKTFNLEVSDK
jgi:hypothetical protein